MVEELVEVVADVVADRVREHPDHGLLRERFVAEFGVGGQCYEVGRFLGDVADAVLRSTRARPWRALRQRSPTSRRLRPRC